MSNELIINATPSEITIAFLEDKRLVELKKENRQQRFVVGDVYLGTVKKIMPGLNAAFINVGSGKDAFLHYHDLGPQFKSLHKYVDLTINRKERIAFSRFNPLPDIDKNGKIDALLKSGQQILVQIVKEPISTKGPRLTSEISIAGRNLVLIPFADYVSVSHKIEDNNEKKRLKSIVQAVKSKNYAVIVRTAAEGKKASEIDEELRGLIKKWEQSLERGRGVSSPNLIMGELDATAALIRDLLNGTFNNIHIDDETLYNEVREYIKKIAPDNLDIVKLYKKNLPIFEQFGVHKQIKALFGKTVSFKNGAYLVIEHTEALHVIDVNSGNRSRTATDQESNAIDVNLAAIDEIARQLRLRDMGGIIVVDFIDMQQQEHKQQVHERMKAAMLSDRTKHNILPLSKFGIMQITRQRVRPEMNIETMETCPSCNGSGKIRASIVFIDEIENTIKQVQEKYNLKKLIVKTHPFIESYINKGFFKSIRKQWQKTYNCTMKVVGMHSYSLLEYHLFTVDEEEIELL